MSATSRLPACHTTWQLFLRTVPKLLLFLPSIVNMLPISPGEDVFLRLTLTPYSTSAVPSPGPICRCLQASTRPGPAPQVPPPLAPNPKPQTPSPGRLHAPRTLAPASAPSTCASPTRRPSLVCVLRYLAFSALFHPKFPENAAQYLPDDLGADAKPGLCAAILGETGHKAG